MKCDQLFNLNGISIFIIQDPDYYFWKTTQTFIFERPCFNIVIWRNHSCWEYLVFYIHAVINILGHKNGVRLQTIRVSCLLIGIIQLKTNYATISLSLWYHCCFTLKFDYWRLNCDIDEWNEVFKEFQICTPLSKDWYKTGFSYYRQAELDFDVKERVIYYNAVK